MSTSSVRSTAASVAGKPLPLRDAVQIGDLHPLVIARIVCEWAKMDPLFPMRMFGAGDRGRHVTVDSDRWHISSGLLDRREQVILITHEPDAYRAGAPGVTKKIRLSDLQENYLAALLF